MDERPTYPLSDAQRAYIAQGRPGATGVEDQGDEHPADPYPWRVIQAKLSSVVDELATRTLVLSTAVGHLKELGITAPALAAALATDPTFVTSLAAALAPYLTGAVQAPPVVT